MKLSHASRALFCALPLVAALAGCSSKNERAIVGGCTSMGTSKQNCQCAYDTVNKAEDLDSVKFDEILFSEKHRKIQADLARAMVVCIKKNGA